MVIRYLTNYLEVTNNESIEMGSIATVNDYIQDMDLVIRQRQECRRTPVMQPNGEVNWQGLDADGKPWHLEKELRYNPQDGCRQWTAFWVPGFPDPDRPWE